MKLTPRSPDLDYRELEIEERRELEALEAFWAVTPGDPDERGERRAWIEAASSFNCSSENLVRG